MKRKRFLIPRKFDRNLHIAHLAGQRARLEEKPVSQCPNLILQFGEAYATQLMGAWMDGWHARDLAMRPQLPLKQERP